MTQPLRLRPRPRGGAAAPGRATEDPGAACVVVRLPSATLGIILGSVVQGPSSVATPVTTASLFLVFGGRLQLGHRVGHVFNQRSMHREWKVQLGCSCRTFCRGRIPAKQMVQRSGSVRVCMRGSVVVTYVRSISAAVRRRLGGRNCSAAYVSMDAAIARWRSSTACSEASSKTWWSSAASAGSSASSLGNRSRALLKRINTVCAIVKTRSGTVDGGVGSS